MTDWTLALSGTRPPGAFRCPGLSPACKARPVRAPTRPLLGAAGLPAPQPCSLLRPRLSLGRGPAVGPAVGRPSQLLYSSLLALSWIYLKSGEGKISLVTRAGRFRTNKYSQYRNPDSVQAKFPKRTGPTFAPLSP